MAVTDSTPTVTVQVVVNGAALHEYVDTDIADSDTHVTRYIEAGSEQVFEVHCNIDRRTRLLGDRITFRTLVDGQQVASRLLAIRHFDRPHICYGWEFGADMLRRFRFSGLDIDSDGTAKARDPKVQDLGIIRVELHHRVVQGLSNSSVSKSREFGGAPSVGFVSEKALKGRSMSHSVGFAEAERFSRHPQSFKAGYVDPTKKPFAVYEFRYRSREALKSMLLVPRTPSPEPDQEERPPLAEKDVNEMTIEELRDMVRQSQRNQTSVKREARIKQENEGPTRRKTKGEVITIELDDDGEVVSETRTKREGSSNQSFVID